MASYQYLAAFSAEQASLDYIHELQHILQQGILFFILFHHGKTLRDRDRSPLRGVGCLHSSQELAPVEVFEEVWRQTWVWGGTSCTKYTAWRY